MSPDNVVKCAGYETVLNELMARFQLQVEWVAEGQTIEGSYWGESEAGLVDNRLLVRLDTPLHSALHEACHYICMDETRRQQLHTDAGGEFVEENSVCYLQILLADYFPNYGRAKMWADMDAWGYSFRLGNAQAWFEQEAQDAQTWLKHYQLVDDNEVPLWRVRL